VGLQLQGRGRRLAAAVARVGGRSQRAAEQGPGSRPAAAVTSRCSLPCACAGCGGRMGWLGRGRNKEMLCLYTYGWGLLAGLNWAEFIVGPQYKVISIRVYYRKLHRLMFFLIFSHFKTSFEKTCKTIYCVYLDNF
jgi:hypothetical protein